MIKQRSMNNRFLIDNSMLGGGEIGIGNTGTRPLIIGSVSKFLFHKGWLIA